MESSSKNDHDRTHFQEQTTIAMLTRISEQCMKTQNQTKLCYEQQELLSPTSYLIASNPRTAPVRTRLQEVHRPQNCIVERLIGQRWHRKSVFKHILPAIGARKTLFRAGVQALFDAVFDDICHALDAILVPAGGADHSERVRFVSSCSMRPEVAAALAQRRSHADGTNIIVIG